MTTSRSSGASRHADAFLDALVARDGSRARAAVAEALGAGAGVPDVYLGILQPALYAIGNRWACEEVSVADEHFASGIVEQLMGALGPGIHADPREGQLAVVSCTPDERHAIGLRMVRDLLAADGWEVLDLGAATPAADLAALVSEECPDVVALSTTTAGRLPGVEEVLRALRDVPARPLVVVGGQFWTAEAAGMASEMGADVVVRDARMLPPLLARLARRRD